VVAGVYFVCFLISVLTAAVFTRYVRDRAVSSGWVVGPQLERHIHTTSIPRLGGIAIFGSFAAISAGSILVVRHFGLVTLLPGRSLLSILTSCSLIFLLGLYDDLKGIGPYWKFGIQSIAALILYAGGVGVQQLDLFSSGHLLRATVGMPLTVVWVLLITNAFNLIDGLDGLAAGSAFFSTIVVFASSLFVPNVTVTLITITLAGVILGFLRFNFHPASIFMGDSGSMFVGFMLAALALCGSQKAPAMIAVAIPVIAFGFPIVDVVLAVSRRFLSSKPLFDGDRNHIHHRLLNRGLSQRGAVLVLYGVTAGFALMSLVILHNSAMIALVLTIVGIGVILGVQYLGYAEFSELQDILRRTSVRRRAIANNVEVRGAVEAMNSCTDINQLCEILQKTLRSIGFDGFRLGIPSVEHAEDIGTPLELNEDGELQAFWSSNVKPRIDQLKDFQMVDGHGSASFHPGSSNPESLWELRLSLATENHQHLGHFCLLRASQDVPVLVDFNFLTREFRQAVANAVLHIAVGGRSPAMCLIPERRAIAKAASAG
jgi:UDP-GlcNAc:undecaprenyl-phosphate/decaprenyl-phosphate GlcNAc-1-phosphate transferase